MFVLQICFACMTACLLAHLSVSPIGFAAHLNLPMSRVILIEFRQHFQFDDRDLKYAHRMCSVIDSKSRWSSVAILAQVVQPSYFALAGLAHLLLAMTLTQLQQDMVQQLVEQQALLKSEFRNKYKLLSSQIAAIQKPSKRVASSESLRTSMSRAKLQRPPLVSAAASGAASSSRESTLMLPPPPPVAENESTTTSLPTLPLPPPPHAPTPKFPSKMQPTVRQPTLTHVPTTVKLTAKAPAMARAKPRTIPPRQLKAKPTRTPPPQLKAKPPATPPPPHLLRWH